MKKYIIYLFFFTIHNMNCQSTISNSINNNVNYNLLKKHDTINTSLSYKFPKIELKDNIFSTYKSNHHNANYYMTKDTVDFIGFNTIPKNIFAGDKIDSYNPHGATDIRSAILSGFIELLFK